MFHRPCFKFKRFFPVHLSLYAGVGFKTNNGVILLFNVHIVNISFNCWIAAGISVFFSKIVINSYCRSCGFDLFLDNMFKTICLFLICTLRRFLSVLAISTYLLTVLRSQLSCLASFEQFTFNFGCSFIMCFTLSKMSFLWFIFLPPEESILPSGAFCQNCTFWVGDFVHFQFSIYTSIMCY